MNNCKCLRKSNQQLTDTAVIECVQGLVGRGAVGLVFGLLIDRHGVDHIVDWRKDNFHLIESRHGLEQVERPQIPDFGVGHNLNAVWMEHAVQGLIQFVEFVNLLARIYVPQYPIAENQFVVHAKCCPIFGVLVGYRWRQSRDLLSTGNVPYLCGKNKITKLVLSVLKFSKSFSSENFVPLHSLAACRLFCLAAC